MDSFKRDMEACRLPVAIGFDLDGLLGMNEKCSKDVVVEKRLERVKDLLSCISSPVLACVARSQTPRAYVPSEIVDHLQQSVLRLLSAEKTPG